MSGFHTSFLSKRPMTHQKKSIIGMSVLALAVIFILFSGSSELKEEQVTALLVRFDRYITEQAKQQDREAYFRHGAVQMEGWGYDKKAIVSNVSLEIVDKNAIDTQ